MTNMIIKSIDVDSDKWRIYKPSSVGDYIVFDFGHLPNQWLNKTHKKIVIECLTISKPTIETLYVYNYSLIHFYEFISEYQLDLNTFADLTYTDTQQFLFYLKNKSMSNSTRATVMSALKWLIHHGQNFEYSGFPVKEIFDGDEYKALKTEDTLKTKYIPDTIMQQINKALKYEDDILIKSLLEIIIDTGIRLSEALDLQVGAISEDFTGKPILEVYSSKNRTERFIPVSRRVKKAINLLELLSEDGRAHLKSDNIFIAKIFGKHRNLIQVGARDLLSSFVSRHNIRNPDGSPYSLTFHAFRHTLGTDMLNNDMSMFEIRDYLGHESLHSTSGYAKLKNPTIQKEYKKLGFIGMIVEDVSLASKSTEKVTNQTTLKAAALPDGACSKPINNQGNICAKFNMCIICPKFITTPSHLPIHRDHLKRLKADKEAYMASEYIGTTEHLESVEYALETIVEQLEEMKNETAEHS